MIAVGNENEKIKNKDRWNYCHHMPMLPFWGIIIVYRYYIWLNFLCGFKKQVKLLISLRLYIWLIQVCMLIKPSDTKWKNVRKLHLVHSHNLLLKPHYQKNTSVLELLMFHETRLGNPRKDFNVLSFCHLYHNWKLWLYWSSSLLIKTDKVKFFGF